MKVQHWCNVWKPQFIIVFILVLCGFCKAAPKLMYGMRDNFEEDNSYMTLDDLPNYDSAVPNQIQLHPLALSRNLPPSGLFKDYIQLPEVYDLDLPDDNPPKHPGKKRSPSQKRPRIQLCHFKICNLGRKRATRYLEQIARIDNRKK